MSVLNAIDKIARRCDELWPTGIPKEGEPWYRSPGAEDLDYIEVMYDIFGKTVPTPVSSRWHGVDGY